jgi:hypothetical protein
MKRNPLHTISQAIDRMRPAWLVWCLIGLLTLAVYTLMLVLPIPAAVGLFVRYNLVFLSLIVLPVFFFLFKIKGRPGILVALGATLILFALPLSGLWRSGASEPFIIGGLLPFSDAASYYSDAQRVVEGFKFSAFSARRPLFPALLTLLLAVTGQNLMVSIAILGAVIALSVYFAAREIQKGYGTIPAVLFLFFLFLFYRRFAGATMTENLGLPLGVAGFVVLWSGARQHKLRLAAAGILLLTLALNARAGTFFILPALILWATFAFRGKRRFSLSALGLTVAAVTLGFALNLLVFKVIAEPGGMVFSNFSYTLYGVVAGGKGWTQILIDHPELAQLDDVARSARTYGLIFETWKEHPFNVVLGALKNWLDFVLPRGSGAFGFLRGAQAGWVNYAVRILLSLMAGWGIITAWRQRKTGGNTMLLWAGVGIFLSVPFVPPNDSNQMRVYAATVVFLIAFVAVGTHSLLRLIQKKNPPEIEVQKNNAKPALVFGAGLAALTIIGVFVVKFTSHRQPLPSVDCQPGETEFVERLSRGFFVQVVNAGENPIQGQLNVPMDLFASTFEGYPAMHASLVTAVTNTPGSTVLLRTLDLISLGTPLFIASARDVPVLPGLVSICAHKPADAELTLRGYWLATSFNPLQP